MLDLSPLTRSPHRTAQAVILSNWVSYSSVLCYVAFQDSDDLGDGLAFFGSSFHIPFGFGV